MKQLPPLLLQDLETVKGYSEAAFLNAHEQEPPTSVRLHPLKGNNRWNEAPPVPWCPTGRYLPERPVFTLDPAFHGGAYYVQEASSMFLDHMVRAVLPALPMQGLKALDLCGAPGGKSTLLASALPEDALLLSNEVIRSRASILHENVVRWGYTNNWVCSNDPREFGKLEGFFDLVVVDAPCSGSGLFRKDARALEEWSPSNVLLCAQRQQRIMADVWPSLKEQGVLIYATCSYSPQEDEEILQWLGENFKLESIAIDVPDHWGIVSTASANGLAGYRFFPHKLKGEGFFIAAVRKKEFAPGFKPSKFRSLHDKKIWLQAEALVKTGDWVCLKAKEEFIALPPARESDWQLLDKQLYLRKAGLPLGTPSAKDWLPAHDLALSFDANPGIPYIDVNREQALRFLKKEDFDLPSNLRGWHLISYEGIGLGWVKALGNRFNNYLPKHWRIRMELPGEEWA